MAFRQTLIALGLLGTLISPATAQDPEILAIKEHDLIDGLSQEARTHKFYSVKVTRDFYSEGKHMTFKVIADSFGSDPDIYISNTNKYPTSASNSKWYCEQKGSETCIVRDGEMQVAETYYFGIKCVEACDYKLRVWYAQVLDLTESNRRQMRFDAYSTTILRYNIPNDISGKEVSSLEIKIQPEEQYSPLDMTLTFDDRFQIVEGRPAAHIASDSIALKFGNKDYKWCKNCVVYAVLNVVKEDRYYMTTIARTENDVLTTKLPTTIFINPFQQECYSYFVLGSKNDVRIDAQGYSGQADLYISPFYNPNGPDSNSIKLRAAHGSNRGIVLSSQDRRIWGASTGPYLVCFYAYTDFSATITVKEEAMSQRFDDIEGQVRTQLLPANQWVYSRYTNSDMSKNGAIFAYLEAQGIPNGQKPPTIYYKICPESFYANCVLDVNANFNQLGLSAVPNQLEGVISRSATFDHQPDICPNPDECTYLFAIRNEAGQDITISYMVSSQFENPGNILLERSYVNIIQSGSYFFYELAPTGSNAAIMPYLKELKIKVHSFVGDADLFVSSSSQNPTIDDAEQMSRTGLNYDAVTIVPLDGKDIFGKSIYFSVYGGTYSQYEVTFEYTFKPEYNTLLEKAQALGENIYKAEVLDDEYQERLYSYAPWWSGREKRTGVMLADMIANKVFFYAQWNKYPKHYASTLHDKNDTIAIYYGNPSYHFNGTYYIRLRPDFSLADMLSERQYIYNMYAFSMAPASFESSAIANGYDTLELGEKLTGFTKPKQYQDYRYFMMDTDAIFEVTVKRLPGRGKPIFFAAAIDSTGGLLPRETSFTFKSDPVEGTDGNTQKMTFNPQSARNPRCGTILHSLQSNGEQACFLVFSVTCEGLEECAYTIEINQKDFDATKTYDIFSALRQDFVKPPPGPIISQDYTNGRIAKAGDMKYYFFPIDYQTMKEGLILLNKTQMSGQGANGDSYLMVNIITDVLDSAGQYKFTNWAYPGNNQAKIVSKTGSSTSPELVDVCEQGLIESCKDKRGCALLVGVVGASDNLASDYRLRGYYGTNKLIVNTPVKVLGNNAQQGWYYYWFIITDNVSDQSANAAFDYHVSVGTAAGGNPNLYVSLMDGRYPTETDYDLASVKDGAASVTISSSDKLFKEKGWNTRAGVMVVVGVKVPTKADFTIVVTNPPQQDSPLDNMQRLEVAQYVEEELPALSDPTAKRGYTKMFQIYNWGHRDMAITLTMKKSNGTIMYGKAGQLDINQNIYSGVPIDGNNSAAIYDVQENTYKTITIKGSACYSCWYFVRVTFDNPNITTYKISVSEGLDDGGQFGLINTKNTDEVYINGYLDSKKKFILDSMENWSLEASLSQGQVTMYIGLDPQKLQLLKDEEKVENFLWKSVAVDGVAKINVRETDPNFHLGTYYFVYIKSNSAENAIVRLTLTQDKDVVFLGNNKDYTYQLTHPLFNFWQVAQKFTYSTIKEQVKFHVFQVPPGDSNTPVYHKVKVTITALTPDFYPMVYMKKVSETSERTTELQKLNYPSIVDYQVALGQNPFKRLGKNKFEYIFYGSASQKFTYYTVAVYQYNWGLTNELKSEYQIRVEADVSDSNAAAAWQQTQTTPFNGGVVVGGPNVLYATKEGVESNMEQMKPVEGDWFYARAGFMQ